MTRNQQPAETVRDERLEAISDKIRAGIPVGMLEAIEAIDYQGGLKADRERARQNVWWRRAIRRVFTAGATP